MSCHSSHVGIAATGYAKAVTDLDDGQIASVFHRLKNTHANAPDPTPEEAVAVLTRLKREAETDPRLPERTAKRLAARYDKAIAEAEAGDVPDGRTWAAMQYTVIEAEIAERNLTNTLTAAARAQRMSPDRMAAKFRRWRRDPDSFEDIESPNAAFRLDPDEFPCDKRTARALRKLGFENYLAQRLPCFVYGTLRRNQGNDRLMDGAIAERSEQAHVEGVAIYGPGWGFPYAMEAPDGEGVTKGDLVFLDDGQDGDWARDRLDGLEGFNSDRYHESHYRRVETTVTYTDPTTGEDRSTQAWIYLAGKWSQDRCTPEHRIHHGDWVQGKREHSRAARNSGAGFWWDDDVEPVDHGYTDEADDTETDMSDTYSGDYVVRKPAVG